MPTPTDATTQLRQAQGAYRAQQRQLVRMVQQGLISPADAQWRLERLAGQGAVWTGRAGWVRLRTAGCSGGEGLGTARREKLWG
jgi:hypothetical protein